MWLPLAPWRKYRQRYVGPSSPAATSTRAALRLAAVRSEEESPGVVAGKAAHHSLAVHEEHHIVHHCPVVISQLTDVLQAGGSIKGPFPCQHFFHSTRTFADRIPEGKKLPCGVARPHTTRASADSILSDPQQDSSETETQFQS